MLAQLDRDRIYRGYGFPNDMLVHLNVWNARVRDFPARPVYGVGERSDIKLRRVVPRISWLLLKGFMWRLREKYVIRDFHPLVFFYVFGFVMTTAGLALGIVETVLRIAGNAVSVGTVVLVALLLIAGLAVHAVCDVVRHGNEQRLALTRSGVRIRKDRQSSGDEPLTSPRCQLRLSPGAQDSSARISAITCLRATIASSASTTSRREASRTSRTSVAGRNSSSSTTTSSTTSTIDEAVDVVYHLAALASPIDYMRLPLHSLKVGSYGTHNALGLAKYKRARFLLASTSEVYGDPLQCPQPETYWGNVNPVGPRGVYDEAKRYAEALTMAYHHQQGVDTCIARIFNTYGPKMRTNDGRASVTFIQQAIAGKPLTVFGDGSQTRSLCYVDDTIRGLVTLAESGEHLPVNIGNPDHELTMLELAETVVRVTGSSSEIAFEASPYDLTTTHRFAGRTSRARAKFSAGSRRSTSRKACGAG